jgi:hypothetical protein
MACNVFDPRCGGPKEWAGERPGGWGGIRTHGRLTPSAVFKTAALNHSATHPSWPALPDPNGPARTSRLGARQTSQSEPGPQCRVIENGRAGNFGRLEVGYGSGECKSGPPQRGVAMGLIDRLLSVLAKRVHWHPPGALVEVDDLGISAKLLGKQLVFAWSEIDRIVAMRAGQEATNPLVLIIGFAGARTLVVDETNPCWCSLLSATARRLPRAIPAASWQLQLMAEPASRVEVYHRRCAPGATWP